MDLVAVEGGDVFDPQPASLSVGSHGKRPRASDRIAERVGGTVKIAAVAIGLASSQMMAAVWHRFKRVRQARFGALTVHNFAGEDTFDQFATIGIDVVG